MFAHRGLSLEAPENTLLSFLKALSGGATHLETDVQVTLDGVAVVCHDADLERLTGRTVRVDRLTMAELRRIDLGKGQSFVSLAEALDAFPEARFNIDVKATGASEPTAYAVLQAGATWRVLITSFSEDRRSRTTRLLPGVATSASGSVFLQAWLASRLGLTGWARRIMRGFAAVQVPERYWRIRVVTPRLIRAMHGIGVEVHVWTVNDPVTMRRLLDFGVDGLITDRCDLAVQVIAGRTLKGI
ncbi:MAG: glycerophosphodiester phosphodiesterase [Cryobacterium sp.]